MGALRRVFRTQRWVVLLGAVALGVAYLELRDTPPESPGFRPQQVLRELRRALTEPENATIHDGLRDVTLTVHTLKTLRRWGLGFGLASLVGVPLGYWLGRSRTSYALGFPVASFLRSIPSAALCPLLVLSSPLSGYDAQLAVIAFGSVWPILINTAASVRDLRREALDSVAFLQLGRLNRTWLLLRWSSPGLLAGMEISVGVALLLAVTVEWMYPHKGGIGWYLNFQYDASRPLGLFAGCLLVAFVGLVLNQVAAFGRRRYGSWTEADGQQTQAGDVGGAIPLLRDVLAATKRKRALAKVRDPGLRALLVAPHVTGAIREHFEQEPSVDVLYHGRPYIQPKELALLARGKDDVVQRDVLVRLSRGPKGLVVLFARSWVSEGGLGPAASAELRQQRETLGDIVVRHHEHPVYRDLTFSSSVSEVLGSAFGTGGAVEIVRRDRLIELDGRPSVLIHEYVPIRHGDGVAPPASPCPA